MPRKGAKSPHDVFWILLEQRPEETFLELLIGSVLPWKLRTAAYCQMVHHYRLAKQLRGENLAHIRREYGLKIPSSATSAVVRMSDQIIPGR
jgi:hypothetical protein